MKITARGRTVPPPPEVVPVILAGGEGRRLRPLSRAARPKPFLKVKSGRSLLQMTVLRAARFSPPVIVCNAAHREFVNTDTAACGVTPAQVFMEPERRGTAPAVAVAAHYYAKDDPLLLVMPADHEIKNQDEFRDAIAKGMGRARHGQIVMLGISPGRAERAFGYIRKGEPLDAGIFAAADFVEKPDAATAKRFLREGGWLWNSGIFLLQPSAFLTFLKESDPGFHDASYRAVARAARLRNAVFLDRESFLSCPPLSFDRAVVEKAQNRAVVPVDMGWSDLGSWGGLARFVMAGKALTA